MASSGKPRDRAVLTFAATITVASTRAGVDGLEREAVRRGISIQQMLTEECCRALERLAQRSARRRRS